MNLEKNIKIHMKSVPFPKSCITFKKFNMIPEITYEFLIKFNK